MAEQSASWLSGQFEFSDGLKTLGFDPSDITKLNEYVDDLTYCLVHCRHLIDLLND